MKTQETQRQLARFIAIAWIAIAACTGALGAIGVHDRLWLRAVTEFVLSLAASLLAAEKWP